MKKINKITNIAVIFMVIMVFLRQDIAYSSHYSDLRVPSIFSFPNVETKNKSPLLLQKQTKLGSATAAFRIMNALLKESLLKKYHEIKEDFNIMMTYGCPFDCGICSAKDAKNAGKNRSVDKNLLFSIFDQFEGFGKIHLVGTGEVLAYGKDAGHLLDGGVSRDFLEVVSYAAKKVKEVRIVTNAYLVPEDIEEAKRFFAQFPKNIVWLVSVDRWHEKQMEKQTGKSLKKIISVMEALSEKGMIRTAYNVRLEDRYKRDDILEQFGLVKKLETDKDNVFINGLIGQGAAVNNSHASSLRDDDIKRHAVIPEKIFPFIDPDGYVVTSDHVAYMSLKQRKAYKDRGCDQLVLGNIKDAPIAEIILKKLLFRNYLYVLPMGKIYEPLSMSLALYSEGNIEKAKDFLKKFNMKDKYIRDGIVNTLYFIFLNSDGLNIESFVSDCLDSGIYLSSKDRSAPDLKTAFEILSIGKEARRDFENKIHWVGMPKWRKSSELGSDIFCPVYEIEGVLGTQFYYEKHFAILGSSNIGIDMTAKFFNGLVAAEAGLASYPLGIIHDTLTDREYYIEEIGEKLDIGTSVSKVFYLFNFVFRNDCERQRAREKLESEFEALGRLAAKIHKAGFGLDDSGFDEHWITRRKDGSYVVSGFNLSPAPSFSYVRPAYEVIFYMLQRKIARSPVQPHYLLAREVMQVVRKRLNEGYLREMASKSQFSLSNFIDSLNVPLDDM